MIEDNCTDPCAPQRFPCHKTNKRYTDLNSQCQWTHNTMQRKRPWNEIRLTQPINNAWTTCTPTVQKRKNPTTRTRPRVPISVSIWQIPQVKAVKMKCDLRNTLCARRNHFEREIRKSQNETGKHLFRFQMFLGIRQIPKIQDARRK